MRKVLSFVLVLALVLGSFSMAFAATPTDVVGQPSEEAVQVLMGLGVVDGYTDGTFKPAQAVTRAEMAKLIVVALGLEDYAVGTSKFADMAGATWAQGYVNYAAGLGIILGYPDGTFKPSQTVSYDEAAAMIVRAIGYTDASLLPATWPASYVVKAKALGILDDITAAAGGADRGDVATMLYNALAVSMVSVSSENVVKVSDPIDNMLLRVGAKKNVILGAASVVKGTEDTVINLVPYVGVYADKYTVSGDIVAVVAKSDNLDGARTAAGVYTSNAIDYSYTAASAAAVVIQFVNGVESGTTSIGALTVDQNVDLAVDYSGKTIDATYSISKWTVNEAALYDATNDYADITDTQSLLGVDFTLDANDAIDYNSFALKGAASLKDIKDDSVVYVYSAGTTPKITKVEVGTVNVTGKVTQVSSSGKKFTINGTVYTLSKNNANVALGDTPAIGETGTAKLDFNGEIYDWTVTDSAQGNFAIVLATATSTSIDNARVKLLDKAGATSTFELASDVTYVTAGTTFGSLAKGDLVEFSTDSDGIIDAINERALTAVHAATLSKSRAVFGTSAVDSGVVVFTSSTSPFAAGTTFDLTTLADVSTDAMANAWKYLDPTSGKIVALVIMDTAAGVTSNYAVLNTTATAINADGDQVLYITGFLNGKAYAGYTDKLVAKTLALNLSTPSLYKLDINSAGVITAITNKTGIVSGTLGFVDGSTTTVGAIDGTTLVRVGTTNWYPIDSAVVVYQLNEVDGEYVLKTMSSVKVGTKSTLWQVDADSEVYDIIVILNSSAS